MRGHVLHAVGRPRRSRSWCERSRSARGRASRPWHGSPARARNPMRREHGATALSSYCVLLRPVKPYCVVAVCTGNMARWPAWLHHHTMLPDSMPSVQHRDRLVVVLLRRTLRPVASCCVLLRPVVASYCNGIGREGGDARLFPIRPNRPSEPRRLQAGAPPSPGARIEGTRTQAIRTLFPLESNRIGPHGPANRTERVSSPELAHAIYMNV